MPGKSKRKLAGEKTGRKGGRPKKQNKSKLEEGQTVLNWSSKGGQKGSSGRARDGPQVVPILMFCAKQLFEQWELVVL